jgi:acetyl-CoA carboxylase biotin carboxyl carrier protein
MFKLSEIRELIRLLDETSVSELHVEHEGEKLHIKKQEQQIAVTPSVPLVQAPVATIAPVQQVPVANVAETVTAPVQTADRGPAEGQARQATSADTNLHKIVSPMVGTFYSAPAPDKPPYVSVGSKVTEKTVVCIVEAMKLMNEIEADVRGEIVEVLVENGQMVDYGQPMFLVKVE